MCLRLSDVEPVKGCIRLVEDDFLRDAIHSGTLKAKIIGRGYKVNEIFIANDGTYLVGYNPHVDEVKNDIPNKEEVGIFIYSTSFGLKSYKVSELTNRQDVFAKSMHGYYWTNSDLKIDEQHKTFTLIKQNQKDKLEFNINTGEISSKSSEGKPSSCLGFILLLVSVVLLS